MSGRGTGALLALLSTSCVGPSHETLGREVWAEVAARVPAAGEAPPEREGPRPKVALDMPLSADDAVRIALEHSPRLGLAMATLGLSRAKLAQARISNPSVGAEVRFRDGADPAVDLELSQSLTSILYLAADRAALGAELEAAKLDAAIEISSFALEVQQRFIEHQAELQALELARSVLLSAEASYAAAAGLHRAGNVTDLRYYAEQGVLERARLQAQRAEVRSASGREALSGLLGLWGEQSAWQAVARLPDPPDEKLALDDVEREALEKSLMLAAYRHRIAAASTRSSRARWSSVFPNIEVGAAVSREEVEWAAGPRLEIALPILDQGQGKIAQADAMQAIAERRYELAAIGLRGAVRSVATEVMANADRARHLRQVVLPLRGRIVEETEAHVNAMSIDVFGLMQAKRDQIQAASEYIDALRDYWISRARIQQLRAGGTVERGMKAAADGALGALESEQGEGH